MIELRRDRLLRVGHRGAAALAPENTLESFAKAIELGCDIVELDVLDLGGRLVVAHDHAVAAGAPPFDEVLEYLAGTAVGVHVDLKLEHGAEQVADALARHGLTGRSVVSGFRPAPLRAVGGRAPDVRVGFTYPNDRMGISRRRPLVPVAYAAVRAMRRALPRRVPFLLEQAGATALMLQYWVVSAAAVERAHALGAAVLAWTVDDPRWFDRVVAAGVDGVITNDPRLFDAKTVATLPP